MDDVRCGVDAPSRGVGVVLGPPARQAPKASKRADSLHRQEPVRTKDLKAGREWAPSAYGSGALTHSPQMRGASDQSA
eukprot:1032945-Pleurochrysis_carterae.AAC.3